MANPNPIIKKAENKYPINKSTKVTLLRSIFKYNSLLSSQSLESD